MNKTHFCVWVIATLIITVHNIVNWRNMPTGLKVFMGILACCIGFIGGGLYTELMK